MTASSSLRVRIGAVLWLVLVLPPVRHALESTMTLQMLVQMPLFALAGWWLAALVPQRVSEALNAWNRSGVSGLLLAAMTALVWMLPRALDAALDTPWVAVAKYASVSVLIGAPLALSWPLAGFVARGVFLMETVAMTFRVGWLYLVSPERLCSNYLLDDQQLLGRSLIAIGVLLCLVLAWKLMWGRPRVVAAAQDG